MGPTGTLINLDVYADVASNGDESEGERDKIGWIRVHHSSYGCKADSATSEISLNYKILTFFK